MTRMVIGSSPTVWRSWSRWRGSRWLRRSLRRFFSPFLESRCFTLLWQWNSKKLAGEGQREAKWCWIGHWTDLAKACSWYLENHIFLLPCTRTLVSSAFLMTTQGKFLEPSLSRHLGRPSQVLLSLETRQLVIILTRGGHLQRGGGQGGILQTTERRGCLFRGD